jgi:hypothetical protein
MLRFNPNVRITADEALEHPFLASFRGKGDESLAPKAFSFDFEKHASTPAALKTLYLKEVCACVDSLRVDRCVGTVGWVGGCRLPDFILKCWQKAPLQWIVMRPCDFRPIVVVPSQPSITVLGKCLPLQLASLAQRVPIFGCVCVLVARLVYGMQTRAVRN